MIKFQKRKKALLAVAIALPAFMVIRNLIFEIV